MTGETEAPELTERMRDILLAVVEQYIETAQPVASRSTADRAGLDVSSATVRATMSELTDRDLLAQPHVSAGRVPTERAFRFYVQHLIEHADALEPLDSELDEAEADLEGVLRSAAFALSRATGQLGFFVGAAGDQLVISQIRFLRVSSESVLALIVSQSGLVQSRVFRDGGSDSRLLDQASARLSELVSGLTLRQARVRLRSSIEFEREQSNAVWRYAFALGRLGLARAEEAQLYLGDQRALLDHPEFTDVDRLRGLHAALAQKEHMLRLLERTLQADVINVAIGAELRTLGVEHCALVTAPLSSFPGSGGFGVIGPLRMRYDRIIPTVRAVSRRVGDYFC